jgi:exodeoxyribonuclease VII large subunit
MTETYLNTAYKDREQVKALGAKWDSARKQW